MQWGPYKALAVFLESADYLLGKLNETQFGICCKNVVQHSTDTHVKTKLLWRWTGLVPAVLGSYLSMYCLPSDREFSLVAQPGQPSSTNTEKQAQLSSWTLFPWVSLSSLRNSFVTGRDWHQSSKSLQINLQQGSDFHQVKTENFHFQGWVQSHSSSTNTDNTATTQVFRGNTLHTLEIQLPCYSCSSLRWGIYLGWTVICKHAMSGVLSTVFPMENTGHT